MSQLTTLLFDVDGTLAETEEIHRQCFNKAFKQAGLDWLWTPALYAELLAVTGGKERIRHYIDEYKPDFEHPENLTDYIADLHRSKTELYTRTIAEGKMPLRPGVRRLLSDARQAGLRLGIATTTSPGNVTVLLEKSLSADAPSWFEVIAAGSMAAAKKPAPDIYLYAMQKMGVEPSECLAIEDSENGLISAQQAGLKTLVTISQYTHSYDFSSAELVVDHLGEPDNHSQLIQGSMYGSNFIDIALLKAMWKKTED
jgi:HAD superfamily hydrolase (TIGR01509 family)